MYLIETRIGLQSRKFTLCEDFEMTHRNRAEQMAIKARKDPRKLALSTRRHRVEHPDYDDTVVLIEGLQEYFIELEGDDELDS